MERCLRRIGLAFLLSCGAAAAAATEPAPAAPAVTSLPASLPLRRDAAAPPSAPGWWSSLAVLTLVGAGGAWTVWRRLARRRPPLAGGAEDSHAVRVSSQALTAHASVHVVRWNGEELLVGCTGQQLQLLARRPGSAAPQEPAA
ncbi:flagellar biosynthetic protein FliO [Ramlibacter sp. USB13]|uniref:Flagellar biosynthetic protein FliO n=1 Tax=Ramlibacter cellulosilyticus TaxID=2764187 RepID=A0A923MTS5_9BURK|nr:flagellar biosynthetic protein FliO [Ramlibacter cellulosilyticus]MBC5785108.1 flagellar biosynthetic protein FliO [Ramlibacter cellulosilyticus]